VAALALVIAALLAACADDPSGESADGAKSQDAAIPAGPWEFTDDRGETVTLDEPPDRIVTYDTTGSALWYLGITPVGIFGSFPFDQSAALEGVDPTGIAEVGTTYGEINMELMAGLEPDLIVTNFSPTQGELLWGFKNMGQQRQAEAIAPIVAIDGIEDPTEVIARFEELATALGADLDSPEVTQVKDGFDQAVARLQAAVEANPDVQVVAVSGYVDSLYFAKPEAFPQLREFASWGVDLAEPTAGDDYWDQVSLELADKYPADVILYDSRADSIPLDELAKEPTWAQLPAVRADQIVPWSGLEPWSYELYTRDIEALTRGIENADPTLVS
jgi:iron complex transport system substrate-binding protein